MIAEAEAEADELARALADSPGGIVGESLQRQTDDVNARHTKLCRERDRLQEEIEAQALTDQDIEDALKFQRTVREGLEDPTWEDKRYYLERMSFEATMRMDDKVKFACYLDVGGGVFDMHELRLRPLQRWVRVPLRRL